MMNNPLPIRDLIVPGKRAHLVGIGGVKAENYAEVLATGADGAAIISGILGADDIKTEVSKFVKIKNTSGISK